MRFRNLRKWKNPSESVGLLFFAQRMEELLFDYTLDSHKPLALNAPYLCNEALLLIIDIENEIIDSANLIHVLDELKWSLEQDRVAKSLLDTDLDKYILTNEDTPLHDKKLRLEILSRTLEPFRYLRQCIKMLTTAVVNDKKIDIDKLSRSFVTTLINLGVSKQYLYDQTLEYFYLNADTEINGNADVKEYLENIYPTSHDFEVYFVCDKLIQEAKESIGAFKVKIIESIPEELAEFANRKQFKTGANEVFVAIKWIRTGDSHTARELAERRLDRIKDLFTLFNHKGTISWQERTLIKQCCRVEPTIIGSPKSSMVKCFDMKPKVASRELNHLIRKFSLKGGSFEKFNRVVDFHGIGVANDITENQLLNIWIALETLVPSHAGGSKIGKITDAMLPFLLTNYISRLIERFAADLLRWNSYATRKILKKVPNTKGMRIYEKALHLLSIKSNDEILKELYEALGDFHLLRFRGFQLATILQSREKIKEAIELHQKKVLWQVRRIYRTRNLIVHSGRTPKYIHSLIENGHDYLDQLVFEIIKMSTGEYSIRTFEQAFELAQIKHSVFMKNLNKTDEFDCENISFLLRESWGLTSASSRRAKGARG
jgi:hypothetical protein